ncbi:Serine/threonine-protein kinase LATS1 [Frankliniella fusca]|uniref:Serine/threonine-protein kinase LATS1 n=1 Tax=Frankliniella fusca TaxID=407009 RepID=A0AAE1I3I1_9NEOP|nr:Serine/threonine-protein kinase LATS1 [Frankliniella fusca]
MLVLKQGALDAVNGVGHGSGHGKGLNGLKLMRKPSLEREADSGAGSSRSDSPRLMDLGMGVPGMGPSLGPNLGPRQYSPPPPPPPRSGSTPPPPPPPHHAPYPSNVQQLLKRMSPAPVVPTRSPAAPPPQGVPALPALPALPPPPQRGTSPSGGQGLGQGRQPMILQNGPQVQQQLSQQMQALYQTEPPPPYPLVPPSPGPGSTMAPAPPSYSASIQSRQSPTQDYRKSPSSGIYSGPTSAGSPSPVTVTPCGNERRRDAAVGGEAHPHAGVQKPILQTATAPAQPQTATVPTPASTPQQSSSGPQPPPPSYASSIQHKQHSTKPPAPPPVPSPSGAPSPAPAPAPSPAPAPGPAPAASASPVTVPTTEPPSYASTMQVLAVQRGVAVRPPALPPGGGPGPHDGVPMHGMQTVQSRASPACAVMQRKYSAVAPGAGACQDGDTTDGPRMTNGDHASAPCPPLPPTASSSVANKCHGMQNGDRRPVPNPSSSGCPPGCPPGPHHKVKHQSPIPERKHFSKEKEEERRDSRVRNYSPQAFKFYMEQHIENLFKSSQARLFRIRQLENEMKKADLSRDAQFHMRKMLSKRESNYIRMRRAKMDKSMFTKIKETMQDKILWTYLMTGA